ncbi:acyloxyacyl hydrolase [uncultured Pseudodesulfovibrio sp.]|uniref:acyloxyacyl hydrolase n=1 Tax=uncultured Pseudodesulfovibrio sp. TaxID=2035858 RepID=UPI0029C6D6F8|nr:acyloxyacyl hydrolase [uncultured Pseudodesulfovibrio sp.]
MTRFAYVFVVVLIVMMLGVSARADEPIISEVRGGVYAHDISFWSFNRESGADINGEILFVSPSYLEAIWSPRPHLGATVNMSGNTSHAYGGLTWEWGLFDDFFMDANLGLSVNNGKRDTDDPDRKSLGSPVLFRLGAALGYNLTEKVNVSVQYEHMSNAYIANENEGMDNVGLRLGYRF